ncbi:2-oxo acid dehydrogenase subunit E2 [Candidatus Chloroploca sp. M-50]|uniref:Dihydrolipoamide acetyltransferase component of pyruvate dehydrogenase complex n=1 Tax=Candidatus Chloroploca mongolica TaxID=2528176 RepID=A0ABS4D8P6_9CHLR|nr:dihydrolipoamide acetyltransferase family protein [Candidatus Chloroploca mongolica]MBP1465795.1 2-oxo acid dehydrogenase subunit E2 [Candidatus Chloroploca mongolica]
MTTELTMPQLGESVTEGTIGRWLKQPGEPVAKYEPLLEVITDKVDSEVPAPVAGTLLEILVPEGETVRVGTVIARLGSPAGAVAPAPPEMAVQPAPTEAGLLPRAEVIAALSATPTPSAPAHNTFLSPVVARLIAEHGLDPAGIPGTGQGGRITKQDVLRFVAARDGATTSAPAQPATPVSAPVPAMAPAVAQVGPAMPGSQARSVERIALPEDAELVTLSPMRRRIAEHMERSVRIAPHVTTVMEVDLSSVMAHREAQRASFEQQGVRLTVTPYVVQAVATALGKTPVLNGSFTAEGIVIHRRIHIGVAVALDEGLLVPVVRDADEKNLLGLARAVGDLASRARTRRLQPDETQGGTFTITNHGVGGSLFATPIINQPQAAILGVGAVVKRPIIITQHGVDAIAIKPMAYLSLTFDHRIADGATADAFLLDIKRALEAV